MACTRYRSQQYNRLFDAILVLAADPSSELYHNGEPHRGAGHRAAFWDGYSGMFTFSGPRRSANVIPGTMSAVCFAAGRQYARTNPGIKSATFSDPRLGITLTSEQT